jgi:NAD(P)H-hydrate epimerase
MMGAALLCAGAALRSGAGLVTVSCDPSYFPVVHCRIPEVMCRDRNFTEEELKRYDAVAIGPGLGNGSDSAALLTRVLQGCEGVVIADADALNAAASFQIPLSGRGRGVVITPHEGEAARLLGSELAFVTGNRARAVAELAVKNQACCVLKGADTLIADLDGSLYVNTTGNPGMATAGAGDALTGVIAAFAAQRNRGDLPLGSAAVAGVFIHGLAGDLASEVKGQYGLIAGDIVDAIPLALLKVLGR